MKKELKLIRILNQAIKALSTAESIYGEPSAVQLKEMYKAKKAAQKAIEDIKARAKETTKSPTPDFMRPLVPSPHLAEVIGSKPRPRTELIAALWQYIKKNELQDKKNRRFINADAALKPIFGNKKQVSMFELAKVLSKHLTELNENTKD